MRLSIAVVALFVLSACGSHVERDASALTPGIFLDPNNRDALASGQTLRPIIDKGLQVTKIAEGFRPHLYDDAANYCTIAYGHLIKRKPCNGSEPPDLKEGVSEPAGGRLLLRDMEGAQRTVMTAVQVQLNDTQFAALCDFVYNAGPSNFKNSGLLRVVNAMQFDQVPVQLRRWVMAGGQEIAGLKSRRSQEIALFFDGQFVPRAAPSGPEGTSPLDIRTGR
jgi:lysozyme